MVMQGAERPILQDGVQTFRVKVDHLPTGWRVVDTGATWRGHRADMESAPTK
jgi:hypothetical protein